MSSIPDASAEPNNGVVAGALDEDLKIQPVASDQVIPDDRTASIVGAPARQWLNANVTSAVLEGMRWLVKERPENPVKALGEFLIQYSSKFDH